MRLFARLRSFLRRYALRVLERHADRLHEGPEPPRQIAVRARAFVLVGRQRTDEQWVEFAAKLAANCYREGFQRGFEWQARGWPANGVGGPPEQREEQARTNAPLVVEADQTMVQAWRLGHDPRDPMGQMSAEQQRAIMRLTPGTEVHFDHDPNEKPLGHGNPGFHEEDGHYASEL